MSGVKGQSGGARPGAGRKPKSAVETAVLGDPGHRGRVLPGPGAGQVPVVAPIEVFAPADDVPSEDRQVWLLLAPHAFAARTLTRATELSFRLLCRNVVIERALALVGAGSANHRGMIQRVDAELAKFCLAPFGKAIYEAEPDAPANPLEKFLKRG